MQAFWIPLKAISYNLLLRKHYFAVKKLADQWKEETGYAIIKNGIKPVTSFPVHVTFHASWVGARRHDIDSLYVKPILDALVTAGILPDDNLDIVSKVTITGAIRQKTDALLVQITSA